MFCGGSKFIALGAQTSECLGFFTFDHVLIKCPVCLSILTFCSGIRFGLSPPLSVLVYLIDLLVSDITSVLCGVRYADIWLWRRYRSYGLAWAISLWPGRDVVWPPAVHPLYDWRRISSVSVCHLLAVTFLTTWRTVGNYILYYHLWILLTDGPYWRMGCGIIRILNSTSNPLISYFIFLIMCHGRQWQSPLSWRRACSMVWIPVSGRLGSSLPFSSVLYLCGSTRYGIKSFEYQKAV